MKKSIIVCLFIFSICKPVQEDSAGHAPSNPINFEYVQEKLYELTASDSQPKRMAASYYFLKCNDPDYIIPAIYMTHLKEAGLFDTDNKLLFNVLK